MLAKNKSPITGKQKKDVAEAVKKARPNGDGKVPVTAQQSIPFRQMFKDGICRVNDKLYNKTIQFYDINYQLAQNEDKTSIFENYCDFLNYFDSSNGWLADCLVINKFSLFCILLVILAIKL